MCRKEELDVYAVLKFNLFMSLWWHLKRAIKKHSHSTIQKLCIANFSGPRAQQHKTSVAEIERILNFERTIFCGS
jgi:hypothetical protein